MKKTVAYSRILPATANDKFNFIRYCPLCQLLFVILYIFSNVAKFYLCTFTIFMKPSESLRESMNLSPMVLESLRVNEPVPNGTNEPVPNGTRVNEPVPNGTASQ